MKIIKLLEILLIAILLCSGCGRKVIIPAGEPTTEGYTVIPSQGGEAHLSWQTITDDSMYTINENAMFIYRNENEIIKDSVLIVKGVVVSQKEYTIDLISGDNIEKDKYVGTVYEIKIGYIYHSDDERMIGETITVRNTFSSKNWNSKCIKLNEDDEYIFFLARSIQGEVAFQNIADYGFILPWDDLVIIKNDNYIYSSVFETLVNDKATYDIRYDIYENFLESKKYNDLQQSLYNKNITSVQYQNEINSIKNNLFKTYTRSDDKFITDLINLINKIK